MILLEHSQVTNINQIILHNIAPLNNLITCKLQTYYNTKYSTTLRKGKKNLGTTPRRLLQIKFVK